MFQQRNGGQGQLQRNTGGGERTAIKKKQTQETNIKKSTQEVKRALDTHYTNNLRKYADHDTWFQQQFVGFFFACFFNVLK